MKQTPELDTAQEYMRPGVISLDGFLGSDERPLRAILQDDDAAVASMGLTHATIAIASATSPARPGRPWACRWS